MPSAIELRFDILSESRLRELWAAAAIYYGTGYMLQNGVIPHVALIVSNKCLCTVFNIMKPISLTLTLDGVGFFNSGEVTFLQPVRTDELTDYQRVCFEMAVSKDLSIDEHYYPERWTPHCTIAQGCTSNRAVPMVVPRWEVGVRSLIYVEYPPTRLVAEKQPVY